MNSIRPRIERWGSPCFIVPQSEKKLQASVDGSVSTFFSQQLDRIWTNLHLFLECHKNVPQPARLHDLHSQKPWPNCRQFLPHAFSGYEIWKQFHCGQHFPFLKDNCFGASILLICKCWLNLLNIAFSRTLWRTGNIAMDL